MSSDGETFDIAIIGYGPVGATAANLLGRSGLRVLALDRDPDVYARARAIATDEEVIRIWQRAGLAEALTADMLADLPLTFVDANGRTFLQFTPVTLGNGYAPQWFIYQPVLERTLRDGVARYPNVTVLLGHECTALDQDADGVTVTFGTTGTGDSRQVRARYVIAADGGSSPTRTRLAVGFEGRTYEDRWVVIDTKVQQDWPEINRLRFHCDPARPAVDCPTPLGHHRWEFPVLPGDDESRLTSTDGVYRLLERHGITRTHVEVLRAVVYSHHVRLADRWRIGRIFLAGDAAHVMPPWIGQGMASGVRDAENLCWKLATVLSDELPADVAERLLDSYETERMPHVRALTTVAVRVGRIITERRRAVTAVRDPLVRGLMRTPVIGTAIRNARWFPASTVRAGFIAGKARRAVGAHFPQPWVLDERGRRTRLDDALGHFAWAVLLIGSGAGAEAWRRAGVAELQVRATGSAPGPGTLVDVENVLVGWAADRHVTALVLRPDAIVYGVGTDDRPLPPPPTRTLPVLTTTGSAARGHR